MRSQPGDEEALALPVATCIRSIENCALSFFPCPDLEPEWGTHYLIPRLVFHEPVHHLILTRLCQLFHTLMPSR